MTREEILNMPAGRELDALVAEKIFGLEVNRVHDKRYPGGMEPFLLPYMEHVPKYSADIAAAWQVIEKLLPRCVIGLWSDSFYEEKQGWSCRFRLKGSGIFGIVFAETAPLAICRAALLFVLEDA